LSWQRVSAGTRLNGIFEIDQQIGVGGMGEVYKGHVIETGDSVAIKLMLPELVENQAALTLFRKEASALHRLHHDAIVRYYVFTVEPALRRPYLAVEFVDGRSLSDILNDNGPLTIEAVRALLQRLASGLQAAHEHAIVHRDLSPDNIMIPNNDVARAKIIDFGIAKSNQHGTVIGSGFAGKFNYVSPEQLGLYGGNVTAKSDIYSLGLVLVEALTGRPIDMGGSHVDVIEKRRRVPDLGAIDMRIRPLFESMLQPDPDRRPESMAAVEAWAASSDPSARAAPDRRGSSQSASAPKKGSRVWRRAAVFLGLLALVGSGIYYLEPRIIPRTVGPPNQAGGPEQPPKPTEKPPADEKNKTTTTADNIKSFVAQYDGSNCFFLAPGPITARLAILDGFGAARKPFDDFFARFQREFAFEPKVSLRLVTERQCPAVTFLARLRGELPRAPQIYIDQDNLRTGDMLRGFIDHYGTRAVDLLLASDSGSVRNLSNELTPGTDAKQFSIQMQDIGGGAGRQPQLLIAVAGPSAIDTLAPGRLTDAEQFFPRLLSDAAKSGKSLSATMRYFMLEK
jgi:serine/threonine-protein kinase